MRANIWTLGGGVVAAAALYIGGCAAAGGQRHDDVMGMACPKCETVWVGPHRSGSGAGGSKLQTLHWGRQAVCPDCDVMARAYFKDGAKVLHDCPTCKVTPRPATRYTPTHPKGTHI